MDKKHIFKKLHYDISHPSSFGGIDRLRRGLRTEKGQKITEADIKDFLSEQDGYTLHKYARLHFPRNSVFVSSPLKLFQVDLCDMQSLSDLNEGYNYLLTVIDVFQNELT